MFKFLDQGILSYLGLRGALQWQKCSNHRYKNMYPNEKPRTLSKITNLT